MSPEQAQGLEVDHRTDIWSLGVVLFEMLTGKVPFRGEHEAALLYSVVHEEPQTVTSLRADTQVRVERIIRKLLEKDLAKRYQTMQELIVDLKAAKGPIIDMPRQEKSIVVLPFENLSPDPGNAFFADGLTDELIAELSKIRSLRVISRTSAMLYKEAKKSVPTIAAELNVRHVLEGTVRRVSDNLRITAQLIDASTDTHLWAERYSGTMDDVFDLQERLSRQIAGALKITLTDEDERKLSKRATSDSRAYEAWLRARHELWAFDSGAINRAINLTNEALAVVGDDALLYAALSYFCWAAYDSGVSYSEETLDRAEMFAAKSLELDPEQSQALIALGLAAYKRGGVQAKFIRHAKRAVGVDRNCDALGFLGICLAEAGKMAEARRFADEAVARDPFTFLSLLARVNVDLYGGNIEEALSRLRGWIQKMNQESPLMLWWLGHVAALAGREDEAIEVFDTGARMETGLFSELCALGRGALRDDHNNVFEILATTSLRQVARTDEVYPYFLAMCLTRVGETEEALQWLERAVLWGFTNHRFFSELNRFFKPLRDDARFQRLMDLAREKQRALEV
jgi:TolB-like protein